MGARTGRFIRFVGWLRDDGVFTPDRGWETPKVTEPPRGSDEYRLDLLDGHKTVLTSTVPEVDTFGCDSIGGPMKTRRVLGYLPWHNDGVTARFAKGDRILYQRQLAASPPSISNAVARIVDGTLHLGWEAQHESPLLFDVALVQRGRAIRVLDRLSEREARVAIGRIPLHGECHAVILATDGLRSATTASAVFVLPERLPVIVILQPSRDEVVSPDCGFSLIGNAIAADGRALPEEGLRWRVDGVDVARGTRVAWLAPLPTGSHLVDLTWRDSEPSASVNITVRARSERESEWFNKLANLRGLTSSGPNARAQQDACGAPCALPE